MSLEEQLSLLISHLASGERVIPLSVSLKDDEEVRQLRTQVAELTDRLSVLQHELDRAQYLFRCESILNNQLVDLLREKGIKIGPEFFARPYSEN